MARKIANAMKQEPLDAGGKFLKPKDFLNAYHDFVESFNEDGYDNVQFCKNVLLHDAGGYLNHCPRGVVLVKSANGSMLWDAWIRKVPNKGHEYALTELGSQLRNYVLSMNSKLNPTIIAGGGHQEIGQVDLEDDEVLPERRVDPDQAVRVAIEHDTDPRVVIEVELSNRDPLGLATHAHGLMLGWPSLRCVIGLKIYKRNAEGGRFACVCFVWKKRADDTIFVDRVFDMAPKPSCMTSLKAVAEFWKKHKVDFQGISEDNGNSFKVQALPSDLVYPLPEECPDELEEHFTVSIDRADVYFGHTPTKKTQVRKKMPKHLVEFEGDEPLEIDLFLALRSIDHANTKNFK